MNRIVFHARVLPALCLVALAAATFRPTQAGLLFEFAEVGSDVVMTATGSVDVTDLTFDNDTNTLTQRGVISTLAQQYVAAGPSATRYTTYTTTFTGGGNFGNVLSPLSTASGDVTGFDSDSLDRVFLPLGYVSGSSLNTTATFNSTTLSGMGLIPGTYTWSWSGSSPDTISVSVVPEPGNLAVFGAAALAAVGFAGARKMCPGRSGGRQTAGPSITGE